MQVLADGRVRRTRAEWQTIMKQFRKSGLSGAAFCEREEISLSAFTEWKRKLAVREPRAPRFVEVSPAAAAEARSVPLSSPLVAASAGAFELSLPGGVVLRWKA